MIAIQQLAWHDRYGSYRASVIQPDSTSVKAVAAASETFVEAHAEHVAATREHESAGADLERFAERARFEAAEAGAVGKKLDKGKVRKRRQAAEERLADAEIDLETSSSNIRRVRSEYLGILAHHAPALSAEARQEADAAILSLASGASIVRRAQGALSGSTALLAALPRVVDGDEFSPVAPVAARQPGDNVGEGGSPAAYAGVALENLGKAVGYGQRILDDIDAEAKERAKAAKLQAETDAAEDLGPEDDDPQDKAETVDPAEIPYEDEEDADGEES